MEKIVIHKKVYTSLIVASTLFAVTTFNENVVYASEPIDQELPIEQKHIDDNDEKTNTNKNETKEESEQTQSDKTIKEVEQESETDELDLVPTDQIAPTKSSENNSHEDILDDKANEETPIEQTEVREATMAVFSSRALHTPHYTTSFINTISPIAMELGKEYGLYPSVIIAQAALESGWGGNSPALPDDYVLSLPPNYNLFGVKGDYNGESVIVRTHEYINGKYVEVKDYFRKYPSYTESILDYVTKMRYNTTTRDPYIYSGTWVENTESYKDATSSLTGIYATDPQYYVKLNRIIENYNLSRFDEMVFSESSQSEEIPINEPIRDEEVVLDSAIIANYATLKSNVSIYNVPRYQKGYETVMNSDELSSLNITLKEEVTTNNNKWVKIASSGRDLGWVTQEDIVLNDLAIINQREVAYEATITNSGVNIYSRPAWTKGNKLAARSRDFIGKSITVKEEVLTNEAVYAKVEIDGQSIGWINKNGITSNYYPIVDTRDVAYRATLSSQSVNIYSQPAWTEGNQLVERSANLLGHEVTVKEEVLTEEAVYAKLELNGQVLGWINTNGITKNYASILDTRQVAYKAVLSDPILNIYSQPAWTEGSVLVANTSEYLGSEITVKEEVVTEEATYAKVEIGKETLGWINVNGLTNHYAPILDSREVVYNATISRPTINIYSRPAWTEGNTLVAKSADYLEASITVKEEVVTTEATYALVNINGDNIGWIDTNGLTFDYEQIVETRQVAYNATITNTRMGIYSLPAWTEGNRFVVDSSQYYGQDIVVTEEIITTEATYAKVIINGNTIGWINTGGITPQYKKITNRRDTTYTAIIERNRANIYSTPAWTANNHLTAFTADYIGEQVLVTEEIETDEAVYALITTLNGTTLGWLNTNSLKVNTVVYLDAGHGGSESGAVSGGVYEKELNLSLTKKVRDLLESKGYTVVMAREDDTFLSLSNRAQEANKLGADIFVSIHHNAFNNTSHGIETFYYNEAGNTKNPKANDKDRIEASKIMAEEIQRELINETGATDRGVKRANFHVIRETEMPAVLVEAGFIDNAVERAKLVLDSYQQKLANAISNGIEAFFSIWS